MRSEGEANNKRILLLQGIGQTGSVSLHLSGAGCGAKECSMLKIRIANLRLATLKKIRQPL
jgi:hypothetical protein